MALLVAADSCPDHTAADTDLRRVASLLHEEFDDHLDPRTVDECLGQVAARFEGASIRSFVPLLIRRYARDELRQCLRSAPDPSPHDMPTPL